MSRSWSKGSTYRWRELRRAILAANAYENAGRCVVALPDVCTGVADCVHHVKGKSVTGDDPKWLVACCTACNLAIGNPADTIEPPHKTISTW